MPDENETSDNDEMQWPIDPTNLTIDNLPFVMGAILIELQAVRKDNREIKETLKDHSDCLAPFKFSKCKVLPWMSRNKWALALGFGGLSIWLSTLSFFADWISRALQSGYYPPKIGGP